MILPIVATLSLLTLTSALPLNPSTASQSTTIELDTSSGSASLRYPSFQPPQIRQEGSPGSSSRRIRRRRDSAVDLGGEGDTEGGIIVLETNSIVDDGSLTEDSSFRDDDNDSSEGEEEGVFDPSSGGGKTVIKNPKVIPNPKNPAFSSSIAAARSTSTTTTTTSSTTKTSSVAPTSTSVTPFKGQGTYFFQGGVAGACGKVNPDSAFIVALDYRLVSSPRPSLQLRG